MSTKNSLRPKYDSKMVETFKKVYESSYKDKFKASGIFYEHQILDNMVQYAIKSKGGFMWALNNYNGDVMSDLVA